MFLGLKCPQSHAELLKTPFPFYLSTSHWTPMLTDSAILALKRWCHGPVEVRWSRTLWSVWGPHDCLSWMAKSQIVSWVVVCLQIQASLRSKERQHKWRLWTLVFLDSGWLDSKLKTNPTRAWKFTGMQAGQVSQPAENLLCLGLFPL